MAKSDSWSKRCDPIFGANRSSRLFWVVILLATGAVTAGAQGLMATFVSADTTAHQRRFGDVARLQERAYSESGFDPLCMALAAGSAPRAGQIDDVFHDLNRAIDEGFFDAQDVTRDTGTFVRRRDPRWTGLESKLRERRAAVDYSLRRELLIRNYSGAQSRIWAPLCWHEDVGPPMESTSQWSVTGSLPEQTVLRR
jgi:hypothetical protein